MLFGWPLPQIGRLALCVILGVATQVAGETTEPAQPAFTLAAERQLTRPGRSGADAAVPDILLITIDTLRHDHLAFAGYGRQTTPFLSTLAAEGTVYRRAYSTSTWTVPAVASMLTGVYPTSHGAVHGIVKDGQVSGQEVLPRHLPSLAPALQSAGYQTFAVVANGHLDHAHGFARGFDHFICVGFPPAEAVNEAITRWRDAVAQASQPVFVWLHYIDPHHPYLPRQPWLSRFQPDITPAEIARFAQAETVAQMQRLLSSGGARTLAVARALYDSEIAYCDDHLRQLFEAIPYLEAFLVVVTADHGEEFLNHGRWGHGLNLYEETVRVPLVVRPPGGGQARVVDEPVSLLDLPPTLLAIAGGRAPASWQGRAAFAATGLPLEGGERLLLAELERVQANSQIAAIGTRWKLVLDRNREITRLYDLSHDPGERHNLAAGEQEPLQRLMAELEGRVASLPRPDSAVESAAVSGEQEEALRALGYLE